MKKTTILISLGMLSGCAGLGQIESVDDLSIEQLKQVNEVKFITDPNGLKYISMGKIKGLSCPGSAFSGGISEEDAKTQLKIKAVKLNANAVLYPTCSHDPSVDWGNNCWESWICIGEAIKLQ